MAQRTNESTTKVDQPPFVDLAARDYMHQLGNVWDQAQSKPYMGNYLAESPELWKAGYGLNALGNQFGQAGYGKELANLGQATARGDYLSAD